MASSVYDLAVNVSTDIASLYTGLNAAADRIGQFTDRVGKQIDDVNGRFDSLGKAFKALAELSIAGVGVHQFAGLIEGAIEAQSRLVDLATIAGSTASQMSALIPAAKLSGTSMDSVATASAKFSKSLIDVQTGTGKAAEAFKALGFSAADAARFLADPAQGLLELSQHLNTFADGGNKTAAVMALLGKSGQDLLPFLKQLGEQSDLVARVTDQQAEAAHRLEDQWRTLQLAGDDLRNSLASKVVPVLSDIATGYIAARAAGLGFFTSLQVAGAAEGNITAVISIYTQKVADLQAHLDEAKKKNVDSPYIFGPGVRQDLADTGKALDDATLKLKVLQQARDQMIFGSLKGTFTGDVRDNLANSSAFPQSKPQVNFTGAALAGLNQYDQALQALQKQAAEASAELDALYSGEKVTQAEKYLAALKANTAVWDTFNAKQKESIEIATTIAKWREQDVQRMNSQVAAQGALLKATQAYNAAIAASAVAIANAAATSQLLAISQAQDDLKRQYDRGLIDFKHYYDQQTAYQKQAIAVQAAAEQANIDALQKKFVDALDQLASAQALNPDLVKDAAAKVVDAQTNVLRVSTELDTAEKHLNDTVQKGTAITKDNVEQLHQANAAIESSVRSIKHQIDQQNLANEAIGLTSSQTHLLIAAHLDEIATYEQLHGATAERVADLHAQADAQRDLAASIGKGEDIQKSIDLIKSFDQEAQSVFEDVFTNGHDAFKRLGDDIKKYLLDLIYQLTVRPIIVQLAAQLTGINPQNVTSALGGSNPLLNLFGGSTGNLFNSFATSGVGQFLGLSAVPAAAAPALAGFGGGAAAAFAPEAGLAADLLAPAAATPTLAAIGTEAAAAAPALTAFGAALGTAIPVIGAVIAGLSLFGGSLFKHGGPKQGGSASDVTGETFYPGETTDQGNASAQTILAGLNPSYASLLQQFGGTGSAQFGIGFDTDPQGTADSRVSSVASVNGQQVYKQLDVNAGRDDASLQSALTLEASRAVLAALKASDIPAGIAKLFDEVDVTKATQDQINAVEALAATYGKLSDQLQTTLTGAFDGTKATTDKLVAFATIVIGVGDSMDGLGAKLSALDGSSITSFVDALGGAQAAVDKFTFLTANFTTSADRAVQAQTSLTKAWDDAGLTIDDLAHAGLTTLPQTHEQFLQLFNSFDLTTERGRDLANDLLTNVGPAFVAVQGSADAAAQALAQQAQAGLDYYNQHFLTPDQQTAQRVGVDETALYNATKQGTLLNGVLTDLGLRVIPTTVQGVHDLVEATLAKYGADSDEYKGLLALIPTIGDLIDATKGFGTAAQSAADQVRQAGETMYQVADRGLEDAKTMFNNIDSLFSSSTSSFGDKLAQEAAAIQTQIQRAITNSPSPVTVLRTPNAAGQITTTFRTADTYTQSYLNQLNLSHDKLVDELSRFTILSAQYDASRAEQLVQLQDWYNDQKAIFVGNADALTALNTVFQQKWDAIVNGVKSGVDGTLDQLQKLKDGIADYLKGLQVGSLSPLSPQQQLDQAQEAYVEELVKAQAGDLGALGDITKFADAYLKQAQDFFSAPSADYRDIFSAVTGQLGDLAGTLPTGLPTTTTASGVAGDAIAAVVPTNGKMASQTDIQDLANKLIQAIADAANANTDDVQQQTTTLTAAQQRVLIPAK